MIRLSKFLCKCSLMVLVPVVANAAGTYYTGGYQSPQMRYQSSAFSNRTVTRSTAGVSPYNQARYNSAGYGMSYANRYAQNTRMNQQANTQQMQNQIAPVAASTSGGLRVDAGVSYKTGMWQFEMNSARSILHYDNLSWGVFDVSAGYDFNVGNTAMVLDAGLEYGVQLGESTMIDDDITNGGFVTAEWPDSNGQQGAYSQVAHSLSIGTSKSGDMLGLRAGIGLKDFFTWGRVKVTPSIGWRHLKYSVDTSDNYGLKIDTMDIAGWVPSEKDNRLPCSVGGGMTQCWPFLAFLNSNGVYTPGIFEKIYGDPYQGEDGELYQDLVAVGVPIDAVNGDWVDTLDTFYFHQSNVSHSYEVTWSGPYFALDMLYDINTNNAVTARLELGLPMYDATADQPYRPEWQHPKSIQDESGIGSAIHFGMGANWRTALTDKVSLTLGVTYDYYNVSGADANTYLDAEYWEEIYDTVLTTYEEAPYLLFSSLPESFRFDDAAAAKDAMLNGFDYGGKIYKPDATAVYVTEVRSTGWKDTVKDEIDSFFRSLGIRVGLNIKF